MESRRTQIAWSLGDGSRHPSSAGARLEGRRGDRAIHGIANSLLFLSILVMWALFHSDLGGPGSIYNTVNVALIGVFLLLNREFNHGLVRAFAVPVVFLAMSVVGNIGILGSGSYRAALATAIGYALFTLKPVPLHRPLLRRLIIVFLISILVLSVIVAAERSALDFSGGNINFNRNPNGASLFFVGCTLLSLALVQGWRGWMLAVPFVLLTVTTGSRAGAVVTALILIGHSMFSQAEGRQHKSRGLLLRMSSNWKVWAVVALVAVLAIWLIPDAVNYLIARFEIGESRSEQWDEGWAAIRSLRGLLIGGGPATLGVDTGIAAHSSYIEAIGNCGVWFLVTTLIALGFWLRRLVRDGCRDLLWIVPPVLVYGLVENILFNGISSLWLLIMLLGIAVQSRQSSLDVAERAGSGGGVPARHALSRQLVTANMTSGSPIRDDR